MMMVMLGRCLFLSSGRLYQIFAALIGYFLFVDSLGVVRESLFSNRISSGLVGVILLITAIITKYYLDKFDNLE